MVSRHTPGMRRWLLTLEEEDKMTTQQPEALRLAEVAPYLENGERGQWIMSAAAELRRLHESSQELLAALHTIASLAIGEGDVCEIIAKRARAAIAKEERTTP